jgi:DNA polymerase elongation subunit (family B)
MSKTPRILVLDIETRPIEAYVWGLKDQNIALNQIKEDWGIIAWAAKWFRAPAATTIYKDQRNAKDVRKDKSLITPLWSLLDDADLVITQNGRNFDSKKLNARFILNGMKPPSPYRHLDTYQIVKRVAAFTSNKLEYLTDKLCTKYKKLRHKKFPGFSLWTSCLAGNKAAWDEMRRYNIHDVLATEELYTKIQAWDGSTDFTPYYSGDEALSHKCNCGSTELRAEGYSFTATGKFQRYQCKVCGKWTASRTNLLTKVERGDLRKSAGEH